MKQDPKYTPIFLKILHQQKWGDRERAEPADLRQLLPHTASYDSRHDAIYGEDE